MADAGAPPDDFTARQMRHIAQVAIRHASIRGNRLILQVSQSQNYYEDATTETREGKTDAIIISTICLQKLEQVQTSKRRRVLCLIDDYGAGVEKRYMAGTSRNQWKCVQKMIHRGKALSMERIARDKE